MSNSINLKKIALHIQEIQDLSERYGIKLRLFKDNPTDVIGKPLNILAEDLLSRTSSDLSYHARLLKEDLSQLLNCDVSVYIETDFQPKKSSSYAAFRTSLDGKFFELPTTTEISQLALMQQLEGYYGRDWSFDKIQAQHCYHYLSVLSIFKPISIQPLQPDELISAASEGRIDNLEELLQKAYLYGFEVDTANTKGETALSAAILHRQLKAVDLLLQYGSDPYSASSSLGETAISLARREDTDQEIQDLIDQTMYEQARVCY